MPESPCIRAGGAPPSVPRDVKTKSDARPKSGARPGSSGSQTRSKTAGGSKGSTSRVPSPPEYLEDLSCKTGLVRYKKGRFLGKGGFAKCYEITRLHDNKIFACKIVAKASITKPRARDKLKTEIHIHRRLNHERVVKFVSNFEDADNVYIVLELCTNTSLNDYLRRKKRMTEPEAMYYLKELIQGLKYLHKHRVIHRDLKLGNLFLDESMHLKIGDFGLAAMLSEEGEKKTTICGTPNYIAPEILDGKSGHSFEVDVWSLGVIMYTMLIGRPPFETKDIKSTYRQIRHCQYTFPETAPISADAKKVICDILVLDPKKRPSLDRLLAHPWFDGCPSNPPPLMLRSSVTSLSPRSYPVRSETPEQMDIKLPYPKLPQLGLASVCSTNEQNFARIDSPMTSMRAPLRERSPLMRSASPNTAFINHTPTGIKKSPWGAASTGGGRGSTPRSGRPPLDDRHRIQDFGGNQTGSSLPPPAPQSSGKDKENGGSKANQTRDKKKTLPHGEKEKREVERRMKHLKEGLYGKSTEQQNDDFGEMLQKMKDADTGSRIQPSSTQSARGGSRSQSVKQSEEADRKMHVQRSVSQQSTRDSGSAPGSEQLIRGGSEFSERHNWERHPSKSQSVRGAPAGVQDGIPATDSPLVTMVDAERNRMMGMHNGQSTLKIGVHPNASNSARSSTQSISSANYNYNPSSRTGMPYSSQGQAPMLSAREPSMNREGMTLGLTPAPRSARRHDSRDGRGRQEEPQASTPVAILSTLSGRSRTRGQHESIPFQMPAAGGMGAPERLASLGTLPDIWVSRWVDYSTKYGVGYFLADGAVGVYFNDSTKIIALPCETRFDYITRRTADRPEIRTQHLFNCYPPELNKKVTLLRHFKKYLVDRTERDGAIIGDSALKDRYAAYFFENNDVKVAPRTPMRPPVKSARKSLGIATPRPSSLQLCSSPAVGACVDMLYTPLDANKNPASRPQAQPFVKKWLRTRRCVLFQMSNKIVQVHFNDNTEIILSSRSQLVTYVDRQGDRYTYPLSTALDVPSPELAKRLRYTKDVLVNLLSSPGAGQTSNQATAH